MTHPLSRRRLIAATCAIGVLGAARQGHSQTADWPQKTVRLIVPFAPGGNTDMVARLVGPRLAQELGHSVIVENVSGASGVIGSGRVAKAPADGYTLLVGTVGTQAINPSLFNSLSEKSLDDFQPITLFSTQPNVLVVHPDLPVANVAELIAYARKRTPPISFASAGAGSSSHLSGEMFMTAAGLSATHVPYRGSALAMTDLMGRQVDMMFDNLSSSWSLIQSAKLKVLAVTSARRNALLPNVPTMIESGFADFEIGAWNGILAPAGTPRPVVERLDRAMRKVAGTQDFRQQVEQLGAEPRAEGPEAFAAFIRAEYQRWARVIKTVGIEKQ